MFARKPLQNLAYETILDKIYSREMDYDTVYSETRIAQALSLSRTPVRDALNRLMLERYIDIIPNRGFRLHKPSREDLREAYHVRMMIEGYCARIVTEDIHQSAAQSVVLLMESALNQQQAQVSGGHVDVKEFWLEDLQFHCAVLGYLNIASFINQYNAYVHNFMPHYLQTTAANERYTSTLTEHREILEAMRSGNVQGTLAAIRNHLDTSLAVCTGMTE